MKRSRFVCNTICNIFRNKNLVHFSHHKYWIVFVAFCLGIEMNWLFSMWVVNHRLKVPWQLASWISVNVLAQDLYYYLYNDFVYLPQAIRYFVTAVIQVFQLHRFNKLNEISMEQYGLYCYNLGISWIQMWKNIVKFDLYSVFYFLVLEFCPVVICLWLFWYFNECFHIRIIRYADKLLETIIFVYCNRSFFRIIKFVIYYQMFNCCRILSI